MKNNNNNLTEQDFNQLLGEIYLGSKCNACDGTGYNPYPNHDTTPAICAECKGEGITFNIPNQNVKKI